MVGRHAAQASAGSAAFRFVLTMSVVNLFADITYVAAQLVSLPLFVLVRRRSDASPRAQA